MATTTTTSGAVATGAQQITLAAFTNPGNQGIGALVLGQWATGERVLIVDSTYSPTISVVRGYGGTPAAAHANLEGFTYGLSSDAFFTTAVAAQLPQPVLNITSQEVTGTGATGSTAATVTGSQMGFLNVTGASGVGVNLPVPTAGMSFQIANKGTGAINIYSVGATINGTTGTTAFALTATGNKFAIANCATAGAWQIYGNT